MAERPLTSYLENGNVAMYGYRGGAPDFARAPRIGRFRMFVKGGAPQCEPYMRLQEMRDERADVYFLDNEATKVMLADFPATAHYVLVRAAPHVSWVIALPGILRRLKLGLLRYEGRVTIPVEGKQTHWFAYRHVMSESLHTRLSISESVGVAGLLAYLRTEQVRYVVLRFFEKLPALQRVGGDIDLLISDEDEKKVKTFLKEHPGTITVDAWTVSRKSFNDITYYPPPLARAVLDSSIEGPGGALVPSPGVALWSFIYHVLYHKGLFAGVASTLLPELVNKTPENDYAGEVARLAREAGVELTLTMEALDEYLATVGWRPKLDTLAKIAPRNRWVWQRFFAHGEGREVGLGVFIIKARANTNGTMPQILDAVRHEPGFSVLREKVLTPEEVIRVSTELRGGVWHGAPEAGDLTPAVAVLVLDDTVVKQAKAGTAHAAFVDRIRTFKRRLRKQFDTNPGSSIHATDNTTETWDYVTHCFLGEEESIRDEIEARVAAVSLGFSEWVQHWIRHIPNLIAYTWTRAKRRVKEGILGFILR